MMSNNFTPTSTLGNLYDSLEAVIQARAGFAKRNRGLDRSLVSTVHDSLSTSGDVDESDSADTSHSKQPQGTLAISNTRINGYKDYSRVPAHSAYSAAGFSTHMNSGKEPTFPVKLHMILSNPEFEEIIAWLPHGRSWRIIQQAAFEERILPLYFRHGRYSSFARQVNGWGFRRVTHGSDYNSYYHEMFLIHKPHLCEKMRRLTSKDIAARKKSEDEQAPNFYILSRENPLFPVDKSSAAIKEPTKLQSLQQPIGDAFNADSYLADRRRALGLVSLFSNSGGYGVTVAADQPLGGFQNRLTMNNFRNFTNVNTGDLLFMNLMQTQLSAVQDCMRQVNLQNGGDGNNTSAIAQLLSLNANFSGGSNFNF